MATQPAISAELSHCCRFRRCIHALSRGIVGKTKEKIFGITLKATRSIGVEINFEYERLSVF